MNRRTGKPPDLEEEKGGPGGVNVDSEEGVEDSGIPGNGAIGSSPPIATLADPITVDGAT